MIRLEHVGKVYQSRQGLTHAVGDVSLTVNEGEFLSIVGPSGCGKSTLLNMIASRIGTGKLKTIVLRLIISVLRMREPN